MTTEIHLSRDALYTKTVGIYLACRGREKPTAGTGSVGDVRECMWTGGEGDVYAKGLPV